MERDCILTWYPWKKLSISFTPVLYGKPCIRTNAPGWGRIGVWAAVAAAAATAPGGAAIYPTVVGDTGGLEAKEEQNYYESQYLLLVLRRGKDETEKLNLRISLKTTEKAAGLTWPAMWTFFISASDNLFLEKGEKGK